MELNMIGLINTLLKIFLFMCAGFIGRKTGILDDTADKILSKVLMNITLPCMIIASGMSANILLTNNQIVSGFIFAFVWQLFIVILSFGISKIFCKEKTEHGAYTFMIAFGNLGIFGFPVIKPLFGDLGLQIAALFNAVLNIFMFSVGIYLVSGGKVKGKQMIKTALCPSFITAVLAPILLLLRLPYPVFLHDTIDSLSGMTLPILMIISGSTLASQKIKNIVCLPKVDIASAIRLLLIPIIISLLAHLLIKDESLRCIAILEAAMPIAGISTSFNILYGSHAKESSDAVFLSTFVSLFTIPLVALFLL